MADLRNIITEEDPLLHQPCQEVRRFNDSLHQLLDDMKYTMYEANGVGLAAPQVGVAKRVIVVDDRENGFMELVNPRILRMKGREEGVEFCLSVPERGGLVDRATEVRIAAQDRQGGPVELIAKGYLARVFQHEIDHLEGRLFTDVMIREVSREEAEAEEEAPPRRVLARSKNKRG